MKRETSKRPGPKPKPRIRAGDIEGAGYLSQILDLLEPLHDHRLPDPKRRLHYDHFCSWLLLYFFSPVLTSMRGLQQASELKAIQRKLGLSRFSLGSFSEAAQVFDPELLIPIIEQIVGRLGDIEADGRLKHLPARPTAVDGTLIRALPKMVWALWRDDERRAVKLHLQFDILKGAPQKPELTHANASETRTFEQHIEPGRLYIHDRGFFDYDMMAKIMKAGSSFLVRARDTIAYETERENNITAEAARAGVVEDRIVRVGSTEANRGKIDRALRLVRIHVEDSSRPRSGAGHVDSKTKSFRAPSTEHTLTLLTDQLDMDVDLLALLYRHRWQIELFFRWFKKILQADRLLALSQNGLTIITYCALIASLLVVLWTGRKPTKRTFEMLCFFIAGLADADEMRAHLERLEKIEPADREKTV